MNKLTLSQLRDDVEAHTDLFQVTPFWRSQWTDWILIQLIGRSEFDFLLANPFAVVEFIPVTQDTQLILRLSWSATLISLWYQHDINTTLHDINMISNDLKQSQMISIWYQSQSPHIYDFSMISVWFQSHLSLVSTWSQMISIWFLDFNMLSMWFQSDINMISFWFPLDFILIPVWFHTIWLG